MKQHLLSIFLSSCPLIFSVLTFIFDKDLDSSSVYGTIISLLIILIYVIIIITKYLKNHKIIKPYQIDTIINLTLFTFCVINIPSDTEAPNEESFSINLFKLFNMSYFILLTITTIIYIFYDSNKIESYHIKLFFNPNIINKRHIISNYIIIYLPIILSILILIINSRTLLTKPIQVQNITIFTLILSAIATLSADKLTNSDPTYLGESILYHLSFSNLINTIKDSSFYKFYFAYMIIWPCIIFIFNINILSSLFSKYLYYLWQATFISIIIVIVMAILSNSHANNIVHNIKYYDSNTNIQYKLDKSIKDKYAYFFKIDINNKNNSHYIKNIMKIDFSRIENSNNSLNYTDFNEESYLIRIVFQAISRTITENKNMNNFDIINEFNDINKLITNTHTFIIDNKDLSEILSQQFIILKNIIKRNKDGFISFLTKNKNYQRYIIPNFLYSKLRYYNEWYQLNRILFVKYHCCKSFINSHKLRGTNIFKIVKGCYQNFINEECSFISSTYGLSLDTNQQSISLILSLKKIIPKYFNEYCKKKKKNVFIIAKDHNSSHTKNE